MTEQPVDAREKCYIWTSILERFAKDLRNILDEKHFMTEDDHVDVGIILKNIGIALRAANDDCKPLIKEEKK
mgnify:CR=1 FL=1